MQKSVPIESQYESGEEKEFRDKTYGEFYPLKIITDRLFLDTLYNYDITQKVKMINSVFLGIDQIEIDDSFFSFFRLTKKLMKYINISKKWTFVTNRKRAQWSAVLQLLLQVAATG